MSDWLRAGVARGLENSDIGVDRENAVVYGLAVITKGIVQGHYVYDEGVALEQYVDDTTLEQVCTLGNKSKVGLKSRFGHPAMSSEALGTFLGRVKNFRLDGDRVRGDLYLDKSAFITPKGNLADYVLTLAESDPDAFGTSIVFKNQPEIKELKRGDQKFASRREEIASYIAEQTGEVEFRSEPGDPKVKKKEKVAYARAVKLIADDVVEEGAANDGLFGAKFFSDSVMPSAFMTDFLDKFLSEPDAVRKVMGFLERYQELEENRDGDEGDDVYGVDEESIESLAKENEMAYIHLDPSEIKEGSFKRLKRRSKEFKRSYDVITGRLKSNDKTVEQSYRYDADEWTEDEARKHCEKYNGVEFKPVHKEEKNDVKPLGEQTQEIQGKVANQTENGEVKSMSEEVKTDVLNEDTNDVSALEAKLAEKEAELKGYAEKLKVIEDEKRTMGVESYLAEQKAAGKVLPKFEEKLKALMLDVGSDVVESLKEIIADFPSMVAFEEKAEGGSEGSVPGDTDEEKAFKRADEIMKEEKCRYSEALKMAYAEMANK